MSKDNILNNLDKDDFQKSANNPSNEKDYHDSILAERFNTIEEEDENKFLTMNIERGENIKNENAV